MASESERVSSRHRVRPSPLICRLVTCTGKPGTPGEHSSAVSGHTWGGNPMTCMAVTSCHPSPDPKNTKHSPAWVQLLRCCIPARVDQEPQKLMALPWAELSGARPLLPSQPLLGQRSIVAFVEHILLAIRKAVKRSNTWPSSDTLKCDACNVK